MKKKLISIFRKLTGMVLKAYSQKTPWSQPPNSFVEENKMKKVLSLLKSNGLQCETILDVGANKADWSRIASQIFNQSEFFLIEPQIEMKNYLEKFCEEHAGSKYFINGAGRKSGVLSLTIWDYLMGSSFLPNTETSFADKKRREIDIITIDDLISNGRISNPEIVKIDVQGFELEVLRGAELLFGHTEAFILEVSLFSFDDVPGQPEFWEVASFMKERGYVAYDFCGFLRRPFDNALGQCDICFVKENGILRISNKWS